MLLKTSFEAERDEGSDCASLPLSVSNSAKIESSITVESTSGTRITVLMSRTILSTRTTSVKGSNSGASNCNVYSPAVGRGSHFTGSDRNLHPVHRDTSLAGNDLTLDTAALSERGQRHQGKYKN